MKAKLRVCASCEWIYKEDSEAVQNMLNSQDSLGYACPKCGFGSYSAKYVYGNKAYSYTKTQKPWFDKKMADYATKLYSEIGEQIDKYRKVNK